jgi:hypothetical protein
MDASMPVAVPIPYKSRRGWLIAFGVIEILIACGFLLMLLFSAFMLLGPMADNMPKGAFSPSVLMIMGGFQYGLLAAAFLTGGIGSIRCKNWARIFMLVVSGLWLGIGLLTTLMMALMAPIIMRQQPASISPGAQHVIVGVMIMFMAAIMVILPAIFLFFYSRKSVKATCHAKKGAQPATPGMEATAARGLPVPLVILGVWQGLGALSIFLILFMRVTLVFGVILHGVAACLVILAFSMLSGAAAWAIFQRRLIGWQICLFNTILGTTSMVVTLARRPDWMQLYREMGYGDQMLRTYQQIPQFQWIMWVGTIVGMTGFIAFLIYTRRFFPTEERVAATNS